MTTGVWARYREKAASRRQRAVEDQRAVCVGLADAADYYASSPGDLQRAEERLKELETGNARRRSVKGIVKSLISRLSPATQQELKRMYFRHRIRRGRFSADEPEFHELTLFLRPGDIAIDVGANVGQYTRRMASLVGRDGRVIAFEPMAETFSLLTSNCADLRNVTLLNLAASDRPEEVYMELPQHQGEANYYRASICAGGSRRAMAVALDSLAVERLALIKIDAEGHDLTVLRGAEHLLERFRPRLIVENDSGGAIEGWLREHRYQVCHSADSPNIVAVPMPV